MKDSLLKYMDLQKDFRGKSTEIEIAIRQSQAVIVKVAPHLSNFRGKDQKEIERNEFLKDFCIKTAQTNESVLKALKSFKDTFQEILSDLELVVAANQANTLNYQSEVIKEMMADIDNRVKKEADEVRRRIKATI